MGKIDDILESKKWAAEKSDIDEGCLVCGMLTWWVYFGLY
jgi:hypothetical protein